MTQKLGADVGLIDVGGKTPLHWAASSSQEDAARLVSLLIEIKPRYSKHLDQSAFYDLHSRSESKTVINWQDYEGRQALHCAVTESTDAVVAAIIKYLVVDQVLHMINTQVPFLHAERAGQPFAFRSTLGRPAWKTLGLTDAAR